MSASTSRFTTRRRLLIALPLGAVMIGTASSLLAQGPDRVSIRLVSIRAKGQKKAGEALPLAEPLHPWRLTLTELGYGEHSLVADLTGTGPFGDKVHFEPVLPRHIVDVVATPEPDGRIALSVVVARWPNGVAIGTPNTRFESVVQIPLRVESGAHFAVQVRDAFGAGDHLLLLVSATRVDAAPTLTPSPPGGG